MNNLIDKIENLLAEYRAENGGGDADLGSDMLEDRMYWLLMNCHEMLKKPETKWRAFQNFQSMLELAEMKLIRRNLIAIEKTLFGKGGEGK